MSEGGSADDDAPPPQNVDVPENGSDTLFASMGDAASEAQKLKEAARRALLEADRMEAELALEKIAKLEKSLSTLGASVPLGGRAGKGIDRAAIRGQIEALAKKIDPAMAIPWASSSTSGAGGGSADARFSVGSSPSSSLSAGTKQPLPPSEIDDAVALFEDLPLVMRLTLAEAVDMDFDDNPRRIIENLYERMDTLNVDEISKAYSEGSRKPSQTDVKDVLIDFQDAITMESGIDSQIPRQVRKEGKGPGAADVKAFYETVCGKDTYQPSEAPLNTGEVWVIRGKNTKKDAGSLVEALEKGLEEKLPGWSDKHQFCYVMDPSLQEGNEDVFGDPVILVANRDMGPSTNVALLGLSTAASLFGSLLFGLSAYGSNPVILERLKVANEAADYDLAWFNELLLPFLGAMSAIQICHELGQRAVVWRDGFKVSSPTILPSLGLPYLSFLTRIKTSPKDLNSLFDYGFAGPVSGLAASFAFLLTGLQITSTMGVEAATYLPSIPVAFVKISTLGGTLVDQYLGGGTGMLLEQTGGTGIPLHPLAVAGFAGLMINSLDLLPIGASDGARVMQAVLGRLGQTVVGGTAYIFILVSLLFVDDQRDIFFSYMIVNTLVQRDLEIPCVNEIDKVELPRAIAALVVFFVAALVLVPMS